MLPLKRGSPCGLLTKNEVLKRTVYPAVQSVESSEGRRGEAFKALGRQAREASWPRASGGEIQNHCKYSCLVVGEGGVPHPWPLPAASTPLSGGGGHSARPSDRSWTKVISPHYFVFQPALKKEIFS